MTPQAYLSEDMLREAVMEPWEEALAAKGICPKCSDSLARTGEGPRVRFSQCMGCKGIFVLAGTPPRKEERIVSQDAPKGWEHLKPYGYAPGHYMNKCCNCEHVVEGLDKRAVTCRPCAEALHEAWSKPPCQQCGAMTADEALSRCMGARAEGGCHGNDLWPD